MARLQATSDKKSSIERGLWKRAESSSGLLQRTRAVTPQEAMRRSMIASCTTLAGTATVMQRTLQTSAEMRTPISSVGR